MDITNKILLILGHMLLFYLFIALTYVIIGCSFGFIDPIFSPQMKLVSDTFRPLLHPLL